MANQEDIAATVGCSQTLVSMVLNDTLGDRNIRPELIHAIKKTARSLGYQPNKSALAFLSGRHQTLAVFLRRIGAFGSSLIESLICGITEVAESRGQRLWLKMYTDDDDGHVDFPSLLADVDASVVDGLIFGGPSDPEAVSELLKLRRAGLPVVRIRDSGTDEGLVGVQDIQQEVCQLGAAHLIDCGCHRIAHLAVNDKRTEGYLAALAGAGIETDASLIRQAVDLGFAAGAEASRQLLADGVDFDGISAQSDQQAAGAIDVLRHAGIAVPEQVKVIGVDDSPFCQLTPVPLSSVDKNELDKGRVVVRMLLDMIDGKPVTQARVEPILRIRESTR